MSSSSGHSSPPREPLPADAANPSEAANPLEAIALAEMMAAWQSGERPGAETWIQRDPQIAAQPEVAVRLIYEEVCLREEQGEPIDSQEYYSRFPQWRDQLQVLLNCHRFVESEEPAPTFPSAGEQLGEFELLSELDRGALGRVFLATQPALSDRPLVVKLTPQSGHEHLSLARLQHTHIVPLYLVQDFPEEHLRALCMPYLGGSSWARVLDRLAETPPARRTGQDLARQLAAAPEAAPSGVVSGGPALRFLARSTYPQAVSWIGACLADALHYAHQRGLIHADVKPSNVLLAGDGQPMLLDFHLALPAAQLAGATLERLGGTRGYMAPEQQAAATALSEGQRVPANLDGRVDIYSLGVCLYEALSGKLPPADEAQSRSALAKLNPQVSRGLSDIVHKCLARSRSARYRDAGELAADLRRHLADLPLAGVPNRSFAERWRKWRRRKPYALTLVALALTALALVGGGLMLFRGDRARGARAALESGQQQFERGNFDLAAEQFTAGQASLRWVPGEYDLKTTLQNELARARQARLAGSLHEFVERLRFVDSMAALPVAKRKELDAACATIWQSRQRIMADAPTATGGADRLRTDLVDLALLWSELRMSLAGPEDAAAQRASRKVLDEAEALAGPNSVVALARRELEAGSTTSQSDRTTAPLPAARTSWEHFAVGRWLFRADRLDEARLELADAVNQDPGAFWPNLYLARCDYRLGNLDAALTAASVCVALEPDKAPCYYNRALIRKAQRDDDAAMADLDRALRLDPTSAAALVERGKILAQRKQFTAALADFTAALKHGANPAEAHEQTARVQLAQGKIAAAAESVRQAIQADPSYQPAIELNRQLQTDRNAP